MNIRSLGTIAGQTTWWLLLVIILLFFLAWLFLRRRGPSEASQSTTPATPPEPTAEDDLKVIEGIGPKMEAVLKQAGIRTYRDLAAKTTEEIQAILNAAGVAKIINPQTWAEQAKLAAEGKWEELKALQDELKGGLRKED